MIFYFCDMSFRLKTRARIFFKSLNKWRLAHLSDRQLMIFLAIPTGFLAGVAAVLIKFLTHSIRDFFFYLRGLNSNFNLLFFILPAIGIILTIIVIRYIIRREVAPFGHLPIGWRTSHRWCFSSIQHYLNQNIQVQLFVHI